LTFIIRANDNFLALYADYNFIFRVKRSFLLLCADYDFIFGYEGVKTCSHSQKSAIFRKLYGLSAKNTTFALSMTWVYEA